MISLSIHAVPKNVHTSLPTRLNQQIILGWSLFICVCVLELKKSYICLQGPFPGLPPGLDFLKNHVRFQQQQQVKRNKKSTVWTFLILTIIPCGSCILIIIVILLNFLQNRVFILDNFRPHPRRTPPSPVSALESRWNNTSPSVIDAIFIVTESMVW